eukprot:Clim_evm30s22 gene=Clim_evmTU30s22
MKPSGVNNAGIQTASFVVVTLLTCSYSLLVEGSKNDATNGYAYDSATVVVAAEMFKWGLSAFLLNRDLKSGNLPSGREVTFTQKINQQFTAQELLKYSVPGLIYFINNNLVFLALRHLSPPKYQLLSNFKIVSTAVLFRVIMNRHLTNHQWIAVILLTVGCCIPELDALNRSENDVIHLNDEQIEPIPVANTFGEFIGLGVVIIISLLSAAAGVYTEWMLKGSQQSIHLENMKLYTSGIAMNFALLTYRRGINIAGYFFEGWDLVTFIIMLNLALNGVAISFVMKYADNIIKLFAGATAMFMSMFLSSVFFGYEVDPPLVAGATVVSCAMYTYSVRETQT